MGLLIWLEESGLGIYIRESLWGYPLILSSHGVGMATVMGVVIALNMRVLGYANQISLMAYDKLFVIGWVGFLVNLASGLVLYAGRPTEYTFQGSFQLKIGFILAGGILMKVLMSGIRNGRDENATKFISIVCLACWFGGVITGRLMAYLA